MRKMADNCVIVEENASLWAYFVQLVMKKEIASILPSIISKFYGMSLNYLVVKSVPLYGWLTVPLKETIFCSDYKANTSYVIVWLFQNK